MGKPWNLVVVDNTELAATAAGLVRDQLKSRPESVLALPTGRTPLRMYGELVRMSENGEIDFTRATAFNLDELYSLPPEHPASFASYLGVHLLDWIPIRKVFLLNGTASDVEGECERIEEEISRAGGLDLAILGIGQNGHIAFNEPGSRHDSRTRLVALNDATRWAMRRFFPVGEDIPYTALTMGISTILEARAVLLMAAGRDKSGILARALTGPITEDVPASFLQRHPRLTVIADREAASLLTDLRTC